MQPVIISDDADRETALKRSRELLGCAIGSDDERELEAIAEAIETYDAAHATPGGISELPK